MHPQRWRAKPAAPHADHATAMQHVGYNHPTCCSTSPTCCGHQHQPTTPWGVDQMQLLGAVMAGASTAEGCRCTPALTQTPSATSICCTGGGTTRHTTQAVQGITSSWLNQCQAGSRRLTEVRKGSQRHWPTTAVQRLVCLVHGLQLLSTTLLGCGPPACQPASR